MAQVRKFQGGGKTAEIGGYTINTNNEKDMELLRSMAAMNPKYAGTVQNILDNINHSGYNNTYKMYVTADNRFVEEGAVEDVKDKHMTQRVQRATSRKDTPINNMFKIQEAKDWGQTGADFVSDFIRKKSAMDASSSKPKEEKPKYDFTVKGVEGPWDWKEDNTWNDRSVRNAGMLAQWNLLKDYANAKDRSRYDVSSLNQDNLNAFLELYKTNPNLFSDYENVFKTGGTKLDDKSDFYSTFGWFGFNNGVTPQTEAEKKAKEEEDKTKKAYTDAGLNYDEWKDRVIINDDGSLTPFNGVLPTEYLTGNYMFNNKWHANPGEEWLRGYAKIGNRLYDLDTAGTEKTPLYNYLRQKGGFYDLNAKGDYAGSNAQIEWLWDADTLVNTPTGMYGDFYNGNYQYDPTNLRLSETKWKNGTLNDGDQIVLYRDLTDNSMDPFGVRKEQLGIVNNGNLIHKNLNSSEFTGLYGGEKELKEQQQWLTRNRASLNPKSEYYGYYVDNDNPYFTFYINPVTNEITMVPKDIVTSETLPSGAGIKLDEVKGSALMTLLNSSKIRSLIATNPRFATKLKNTISSLTGTDIQDLFKGNFNRIKELTNFGLDEKEASLIIEELYNRGSNNKSAGNVHKRRSDNTSYLEDVIELNKNGGVIKAQNGTVINAGVKDNKPKQTVKEKDIVRPDEPGVPGSNKTLSRADIAELVAVGGDVLGTVAGLFGPVGDIAGSSLGLLASGTRFGANVSRDGFQLGDLGRFAMDAGLDAVGLLPFVGDAARVAKVTKGIQKVSRVLSPLFIGMGLTAAAGSVDKAIKGEEFTVQDWSNLAAGFQALTNAGVLGKQRFNKAKIDSMASRMRGDIELPSYKAKIDKTEVTVTADEFAKNIDGKSKDEVIKFLKNKVKKAGVADNKMPKDIIKHFGLESKGIGKWAKVSDPNMPTVEPERSTFRSFFTPGLNRHLDDAAANGNLQRLVDKYTGFNKETTNGFGVDVSKITGPELSRSMSRTLASVASERGLNVPVTPKRWLRYSTLSRPKNGTYAHITPTNASIEAEAAARIGSLPIGNRMMEGLNATGVTQRLLPQAPGPRSTKDLQLLAREATLADMGRPAPKRYEMLGSLSKQRTPERPVRDRIGPNESALDDWAQSTNPAAMNLWRKYPNLFVRLNGYKQAFDNVKTEASFRKLIANLRNDVEFQLALNENPGLLRQEMLNAAARAGIMGAPRKELIKGMVFKKGGILKGKYGLVDLAKGILKDAYDPTKKYDVLGHIVTDPDNVDKTLTVSDITEPMKIGPAAFKTDYATDRIYSALGKDHSADLADPSSVRLEGDEFRPGKAFYAREALDLKNYANARKTAKTARDLGYKTADIMGGMTMSMPIERDFRYILPVDNELSKNIANYKATASTFNTNNDPKLATQAKLHILDRAANMENEKSRAVSDSVTQQNIERDQRAMRMDQIRADIANKNKQIVGQSLLAKVNADAAYNLEVQKLKDARAYKYQDMFNKLGKVDSNIQSAKDQITMRMNLPGVTDKQRESLQSLLSSYDDPKYRNMMLRSALYAKKGTKLRSTSDLLLLDNQKAVNKAIEKLNDNTMKLILKAMS